MPNKEQELPIVKKSSLRTQDTMHAAAKRKDLISIIFSTLHKFNNFKLQKINSKNSRKHVKNTT
jgi:hypothetical protein